MASLPSPTQVASDHLGTYEAYYKKLDPRNSGNIPAGTAAQFLKKSGLNDNLLSRIWDLSDPGGKGYLDKPGFFVALKLVALVQNGNEPSVAITTSTHTPPPNMGEPPPHPPLPVAKSPGPPVVPAPPAPTQVAGNSGVWIITPADRTRYDQIFNSLGPEANKIHGNKVRGVMMNSKLPTDILGKIWDLSDMDKDGSLDRAEFSIAMHLIYKVLENNSLPVSLPQEMLSSARRAGVGHGPVPAPLAPPSQAMSASVEVNKVQSSGPPPAPWVVTAADKSRYDVMFHNADLDKDGFVSGNEIKGVFLQSGLPQMVLAHIWNICDMKQTGKLTSEQFALAMWLIQQKMTGIDPPQVLSPEMIPPTMRPKPTAEAPPVIAKPTYNNPELQAVADEIDELNKEKLSLESEVQQKEASIRLKANENKNLQTELDTLTATLRQLENQKGAAQKRLDDLGQQNKVAENSLRTLEEQIKLESLEVETLRIQVEDQETSLKGQEEEVMSKQKELNDLRSQEMELEAAVITTKKRIEQLGNTQQETQLFLSQAKVKIQELQDQEHYMTEVIMSYDSAISAGDGSTISETSLMDVNPLFNDYTYMKVGPPTPRDPLSPVEAQNEGLPETNGLPEAESDLPKAKDTSFVDGHDPFAQAFGGNKVAGDPFASWGNRQQNPTPIANSDPFGGDTFVAKGNADSFGTEPFNGSKDLKSESPTPALPPKKAKAPPPRPAPPKARPAKPPPPQMHSNPSSNTFGGGWADSSKTNSKNGGFADFANFTDFDNKSCSAADTCNKSPWGSSGSTPFGPSSNGKVDRFDDSFAANSSLWPINSPSSGFGSGSDPFSAPEDPFGGDYDPFKDSSKLKETDEFSWDDEPLTDSVSDLSKDPFESSPESKTKNGFSRSKSALADPLYHLKIPVRSKTALGDVGNLDFDPLSSSSTKQDFPAWKSNEDLLNENSFSPPKTSATSNSFSWTRHAPQSDSSREQADLELAMALSRSMNTK